MVAVRTGDVLAFGVVEKYTLAPATPAPVILSVTLPETVHWTLATNVAAIVWVVVTAEKV